MVDLSEKLKRLFREQKEEDPNAILEESRFRYEEDLEREPRTPAGRESVDYIRFRTAPGAYWAMLFTCIGACFMAFCLVRMCRMGGRDPMLLTALAACSLLWAAAGAWCAARTLLEKNKNYSLSCAALVLSAIQLIAWAIIIGIR